MNERDGVYLATKRRILQERRANKKRILEEGGQQAWSHSWVDITRIDFALRRIEQGQYGLCCNCGTPIDERRLVSIPETPFCADCALSRVS